MQMSHHSIVPFMISFNCACNVGSLQSTMGDVYKHEKYAKNIHNIKINAVFSSNHHTIRSKCYERYLNDTELTALSGVYHLLYPNMSQSESVSHQHLVCSDIDHCTWRTLFVSKIQISMFSSGYGILV